MKSCLIVGAGMAGLTAAHSLRNSGWDVSLIDKGRGVGGRMATRRIGECRLDHGAQFFTVRDPRFRAAVEDWERAGLVAPWFTQDGHTRYRVNGGMNALARHLAVGLPVRTSLRVERIEPGWSALTDSGERFTASALLLTPPAPQSRALLEHLSGDISATLSRIQFDPCFALLAVLPQPAQIPEPGYVRPLTGPIEWMADNYRKGVSPRYAVTVHARADFTRQYLNAPTEEVARLLLDAAAPLLGSQPVECQLHRWLYSKPLPAAVPECLYTDSPGPLAVAGDAFCGGRVEGAFLSGLAAAAALNCKSAT